MDALLSLYTNVGKCAVRACAERSWRLAQMLKLRKSLERWDCLPYGSALYLGWYCRLLCLPAAEQKNNIYVT